MLTIFGVSIVLFFSKYHVVGFIFTDFNVDLDMQYIDEVCNFLCQNMRVTFKIAAAFAFLYITHVSNGQRAI